MKAPSFGKELLWGLLALAVLLLIPFVTSSRIALDFVIRLAAFGIFATSLNILVGYGGMVSFGHAMFFGGGAYAFALTLQKTGLGIPAAMLVAMAVAVGMAAMGMFALGAIGLSGLVWLAAQKLAELDAFHEWARASLDFHETRRHALILDLLTALRAFTVENRETVEAFAITRAAAMRAAQTSADIAWASLSSFRRSV